MPKSITITLKSKKSTGFWWLPNSPQTKIYCQLNYRFGYYPTLSLDGTLDENTESKHHQIILGQVDNCRITLLNCARIRFTKTQSGSGDFIKSTYRAVVILKGHHVEKIDDLARARY